MTMPRPKLLIIAAIAVVAAVLLGWLALRGGSSGTDGQAAAPREPLTMTEEHARQSGIMLVAAEAEPSMPIASVPATIVLPPDARAAVAVPYPGVLQRVLVTPGQAVARGQAVAVMVSPDVVRIGAELARSRARAAVTSASAARQAQLADEGIIAPARADEARAMAREANVSAGEQARLLSIGGANAGGTIILRAPIGGRVASIAVQPGAALDGMTAPMLIEATDRMQIELQVPERLAGAIRVGQGVVLPGGARGRITGIGASLDPQSRSIPVRATLVGGAGLVPGQSVMAMVDGGAEAGVSVPVAALTRAGEGDALFVYDGRRLRLRPVTVVARTATLAYVREGLRPGERVAASGVTELRAASGE